MTGPELTAEYLNTALAARIAELEGALEQCKNWFQEYGQGHREKGSTNRANRNFDRAAFARQALTSDGSKAKAVLDAAREWARTKSIPFKDGETVTALTLEITLMAHAKAEDNLDAALARERE